MTSSSLLKEISRLMAYEDIHATISAAIQVYRINSFFIEKMENMEEKRTPWHPAFIQAIQMELLSYQNVLTMQTEYQLNAEPYKIDVLITKN
ncbi:MAG: hypothetical protein LBQ22_09605, partial [Bacteroidales bacterium]|nr:hypothetical protein [Bacteroidales bacterium]